MVEDGKVVKVAAKCYILAVLHSHSESAVTTGPVLPESVLLNSSSARSWHAKRNVACGKVESHKRNKQETNTLSR